MVIPKLLASGVTATTVATAAVAALAIASPSTAAPSQSAWVATQTQGMHLGHALGPAPAARRLHLSLTLPLRNRAAMQRDAIARSTPGSASYGTFLTPAQVRDAYGPSTATVKAVTSYLNDQGFTGVKVSKNRLLVDAHGTVAQAEHAFHTSIARFRVAGAPVLANTTTAMVPTALAGKVSAVLGLSNLPMTSDLTSSPNLTGFTAKALEHVYAADKLPAASKTSIALVTVGNLKPIIADLRYAEAKEGFPKVPISIVYDGPKAGIVQSNPGTGSVEWDLDTQISTFMAENVKRLYPTTSAPSPTPRWLAPSTSSSPRTRRSRFRRRSANATPSPTSTAR